MLGDHADLQLRLIVEIANECDRSSRLERVCPWLQEPPHPAVRTKWTMQLSRGQKRLVESTRRDFSEALEDALAEFGRKKKERGDRRPVLSYPDRAVLCTAEALGFAVVTDEIPMSVACKEFGIPHMVTLELLHKLCVAQVLSREKVDAMVRFWQYEKDAPPGWRKQYRDFFGEPIPEFKLD